MHTRSALVLALLLLTACAGSPSPAGKPSVSPSAAASQSPAPAASPTATPTAAAEAACKLPVAGGDGPIDGVASHGTAGHGGFVVFPGGTFTADPASLGSYDLARAKWLPVLRDWVSPDGQHYAYTLNQPGGGPVAGNVHIVDVATRADHVFPLPAPSNVVSYEPEGVYVTRVVPNSGAPPAGLTLVDPATGAFHQIAADGVWTAVGGGFGWGADLDSTIAPPTTEGPGIANRLRKLDLKSGAVSTVAQYPGASIRLLGIDQGSAVVSAINGSTFSISRTDGAKLYAGPVGTSNPGPPIVSESDRIWFGSASGAVWRFDRAAAGTGVHQVASTSVMGLQVAGSCR